MVLRSGTCPGCGSRSVYKKHGGVKNSQGSLYISTGIFQSVKLDAYVCMGCGHTELAVPADTLDKLREAAQEQDWDWQPVS